MSNSPLAAVTIISPNQSGQRTKPIDRITPHCVVGQTTAEQLGHWFEKSSTKASSNYGIGRDGVIGLYVDESCRSWCSSSAANDQRAVTIECASDLTEPYAMTDLVYERLVELCADICLRNGKTHLIWIDDKERALAYEPKTDEMLITVHRWFAAKSCPGDWLYSRLGHLAARVTEILSGTPEIPSTGFSDVSPDRWSAEAIQINARAGLMAGFPDGTFRPEDPVTREQLASVTMRLLALLAPGKFN